ncbi:Similar to CBS: Cystathionine beta-synthase (Apis mellifera) [Cotesia congregata]|uniref:Cystathionine beta-synthase n=1 Tax=Cotesia congregata TaxID=51543 RepID=A0A8J2MVN8_COTCN|nr:Similar to CBS: Cystathionine beta-synthase (Apis mellifera) [Cotesia congregata]
MYLIYFGVVCSSFIIPQALLNINSLNKILNIIYYNINKFLFKLVLFFFLLLTKMDNRSCDSPSKCTWVPNAETPHIVRNVLNDRKKVLPDILECIGQTPMIRLNKIPKLFGVQCEVFAKCEFFNPGGSVKDRIGYRMVQDAEAKGLLKPGSTIIEPTSGNTGIGLAMTAAVKGYRCIIVMPQKMSNEKLFTLHVLGAEIIRTPTEASWDSPDGHIKVAEKLQKQIPNSIILNQYLNPGNPLAHYDQTAQEIWEQCQGKLDYLVAGAGTGGTITGIGRRLRELSPEIKIVGIDPLSSILAEPPELNKTNITFYDVEGIGYDFIPTVLDRTVIDKWMKTNDHESLNMSRLLIKNEGILCGASSGAAVYSAMKLAKDLPKDKRVVVVLPDGIRNYMTKFVSDNWMIARGYMDPPAPAGSESWWNNPLPAEIITKPTTLLPNATCKEAYDKLKKESCDFIVTVNASDRVTGYITPQSIRAGVMNGSVKWSDTIEKIIVKQFYKLSDTASLGRVAVTLEKELLAVIIKDTELGEKFVGVVTQENVFEFVSKYNL